MADTEDFTQDLRILPHVDRIRELIDADVAELVAEIQEELIKEVEADRGVSWCMWPTPARHKEQVLAKLQAWAALYGYSIAATQSASDILKTLYTLRLEKAEGKQRKKSTVWRWENTLILGTLAGLVLSLLGLGAGFYFEAEVIGVPAIFGLVISLAVGNAMAGKR